MPAPPVTVEVLELPFPPVAATDVGASCSPFGTFDECPMCGESMAPEHAHFRCTSCGWRDSCCD